MGDPGLRGDGPVKTADGPYEANFLQRPPVNSPAHLHEDIYFNPFLLQVANASVTP